MNLSQRIDSFIRLGTQLASLSAEEKHRWFGQAQANNNWFTTKNCQLAIDGIRKYLQQDELTRWLPDYQLSVPNSRRVGVVMAGNIPAAGFHDFLCVLLSGHTLYAKLSAQDSVLLPKIADLLVTIEPAFAEKIVFAERLNDVEAIIATGSDNSARYFRYYFGKIPHVIRQNRTSIAILTGEESRAELADLGKDLLQYFGLGCRNVSTLYVPEGYIFDPLFEQIQYISQIAGHNKYVNNYDYNKSIFLINQVPHYDNGFLLLTENASLVSPISVVCYQTYQKTSKLPPLLEPYRNKIQCIVSKNGWFESGVPFGKTQQPHVWEYADQIDTMQFLASQN